MRDAPPLPKLLYCVALAGPIAVDYGSGPAPDPSRPPATGSANRRTSAFAIDAVYVHTAQAGVHGADIGAEAAAFDLAVNVTVRQFRVSQDPRPLQPPERCGPAG